MLHPPYTYLLHPLYPNVTEGIPKCYTYTQKKLPIITTESWIVKHNKTMIQSIYHLPTSGIGTAKVQQLCNITKTIKSIIHIFNIN